VSRIALAMQEINLLRGELVPSLPASAGEEEALQQGTTKNQTKVPSLPGYQAFHIHSFLPMSVR